MSEFHKAFYVNCPIHKDVEHPLWRNCPKCSEVITYTEEEVARIAKDFFYHWYNAPGQNTEEGFNKWFETNKKKK